MSRNKIEDMRNKFLKEIYRFGEDEIGTSATKFGAKHDDFDLFR